jgi:hypothetical protein
LVRLKHAPTCLEDWVALGMTVQLIWLTATHQGLHLQPNMTPVIFRWYASAARRFSVDHHLFDLSVQMSEKFERVAQSTMDDHFGFICNSEYVTRASKPVDQAEPFRITEGLTKARCCLYRVQRSLWIGLIILGTNEREIRNDRTSA